VRKKVCVCVRDGEGEGKTRAAYLVCCVQQLFFHDKRKTDHLILQHPSVALTRKARGCFGKLRF
jgi:hypothetical protein